MQGRMQSFVFYGRHFILLPAAIYRGSYLILSSATAGLVYKPVRLPLHHVVLSCSLPVKSVLITSFPFYLKPINQLITLQHNSLYPKWFRKLHKLMMNRLRIENYHHSIQRVLVKVVYCLLECTPAPSNLARRRSRTRLRCNAIALPITGSLCDASLLLRIWCAGCDDGNIVHMKRDSYLLSDKTR